MKLPGNLPDELAETPLYGAMHVFVGVIEHEAVVPCFFGNRRQTGQQLGGLVIADDPGNPPKGTAYTLEIL